MLSIISENNRYYFIEWMNDYTSYFKYYEENWVVSLGFIVMVFGKKKKPLLPFCRYFCCNPRKYFNICILFICKYKLNPK